MVYPESFLPRLNRQPAAASVNAPDGIRECLAAAIDELPPTGKLVLSLHYYEALDMDEVAAVLSLELPEVERQHAAALHQLYASGRLSVAA